MKNALRIAFGGAVLVAAASMVIPEEAAGWTTIGGSLSLGQRDFRLFDNFTHSRLHNNNTAHSNWPGFTQVELACWKGGAEWGSRVWGDGTGDPTQNFVGTGNAHMNFFWSGNAGGVGGTNDNIHSMIPGSNGGVLAFTETPISNGWRIRYYADWNWFDGPGSESGSDFQGVACHELGHALGLGHSDITQATMYLAIQGNGTGERSIHFDDQQGVQAVYGVRDDNLNPRIDNIGGNTSTGGTVIVTGINFASTNNEIWMNALGNQGNPLKVTNLSSTAGGTQISFTMPAGVDPGGLHVKSGALSGNAGLSEGHPFDPSGGPPMQDFYTLSGPSFVFAGTTVQLDISGAPALCPYTIYASANNSGTVLNGATMDIGPGLKQVATGTTNVNGDASVNRPVPLRFAGRTFYLEALCNDGGVFKDSTFIQIDVL